MKYYRVKYGFDKDDFYSIDETELKKAIVAQTQGSIFICNEGTISGNNIVSIMPDYNRVLGLNRDYQLTGEDYDLLGAQAVKDHRNFLQQAKTLALENRSKPKQLSDGTD